jgi:hypothetical protein
MAQSPEYPDLRWMPPKSWTDANRTAVQLIVIHTTEGSEGPTSAEDGAGYDQRRTDGTSTHFFHDRDSTVQCVRTADQAHAARAQGNRRGIQHELCGRAGQGAAGWDDPDSQGTLRQAAKQCARDAKKWGIPVRRLTVAQVAAGDKGICGHVDITHAFPQDNGTHTDPGPTFPWSQFLDLVRAEMEGDDMTKADFIEWLKDPEVRAALCRAVAYTDGVLPAPPGSTNADGKPNAFWTLWGFLLNDYNAAVSARTYAAQARDKDAVDEQALAAALAAALPAGVQVTEAQLQAALVGALRELAA